MTPSLAIRIEHGLRLIESPAAAKAVAEILVRPCFSELARLSGRHKDRWSRHTKPTADAVLGYLTDSSFDAAAFDTPRGREIAASAEVENGVRVREMAVPQTRYSIVVAMPLVATELTLVVDSVCELAAAVHAAAGYIALEPRYGLAHKVAIPGSRPHERVGLSEQRFRERRGRGRYEDRIVAELAGIEWGTFLGAGHLPRIDLEEVRRSGTFTRVDLITPELAYLQVTEDPMDDLSEGFESRLIAARRALASLLMDVSGISLE